MAATFLALVTSAVPLGNTRPSPHESESVARIQEVSFFSLSSSAYDDLTHNNDEQNNTVFDPPDSIVRDAYQQNMVPIYEHPCASLSKLFTSGTFYYATEPPWDISTRLSKRVRRRQVRDPWDYDERFVWNEAIVRCLLEFRESLDWKEKEELDLCRFIVSAVTAGAVPVR